MRIRMILRVFEGKCGSGKTLSAVAFMCGDLKKTRRPLISDVKLPGIDHKYYQTEKLLNLISNKKLDHCSVLVDSAYSLTPRNNNYPIKKFLEYLEKNNSNHDIIIYLTISKFTFLQDLVQDSTSTIFRCNYDKDLDLCYIIELNPISHSIINTYQIRLSPFFGKVDQFMVLTPRVRINPHRK
jgi:hypothetical protein